MREEWQPATRFVNVVLNGVPRGLYLLSESVKDGDCRLPVGNGGFILEDDPYWWSEEEAPMFPSKVFNPYMKFTFKHPDEDDITEEQINSISNFIYEFEDALLAGEPIEKYADIATFAAWMLCHDILGTADSAARIFISIRKILWKRPSCKPVRFGTSRVAWAKYLSRESGAIRITRTTM